jgi:hypothetical protein
MRFLECTLSFSRYSTCTFLHREVLRLLGLSKDSIIFSLLQSREAEGLFFIEKHNAYILCAFKCLH